MALAMFRGGGPGIQSRSGVKAKAAGGNGASPAAAAAPKPAAAAPKARPAPAAAAAASAAKQFTNINRFYVPPEVQPLFLANWRQREADMQHHSGFVDFKIDQHGNKFTVSSSWASIPDWEAWSLAPECRRSHLPWGIYQWVPKKGEGFPEDFVAFVDYDEPVSARY